MKEAMSKGRKREEVVAFLYEMYGMPAGASFQASGMKKEFPEKRSKRIAAHAESEAENRNATKLRLLEFKSDNDVYHNEQSTH